jgi:hypothetical protein
MRVSREPELRDRLSTATIGAGRPCERMQCEPDDPFIESQKSNVGRPQRKAGEQAFPAAYYLTLFA